MSGKVIAITAGHNNKDVGAVNTKLNVTEASIATECRNIITFYLKEAGIKYLVDGVGQENKTLSEAIALAKKADLAVEIHCNAASKESVRGVEALSHPKHKTISQKLCAVVANTLNIPLRGDKGWKAENSGQHSRLGFISQGGGIILELDFISNNQFVKDWEEKKWLIGKAIAQVLIDYANGK